jgi:tRNA (guanine26-N2/guanine27-N2)-dimethyltransferase
LKNNVIVLLLVSGLRAVRYAKELRGVRSIVANDFDPAAVTAIARNVAFNDVDPALVRANHADAWYICKENWIVVVIFANHVFNLPGCVDVVAGDSDLMIQSKGPGKQFDVVDLDPYGSASVFLDSAMQCISEGGM